MRIYYFIGRMMRPFMVVALFFYSYTFRTPRARVVLVNEQDEILFVQSWLSSNSWALPGGGVDRGESPAGAATRELREEVGITLPESSLEPLITLKSWGHDEVAFLAHVRKGNLPEELPNKFEIKDAKWFSLNHLPMVEPLTRDIIAVVEKRG